MSRKALLIGALTLLPLAPAKTIVSAPFQLLQAGSAEPIQVVLLKFPKVPVQTPVKAPESHPKPQTAASGGCVPKPEEKYIIGKESGGDVHSYNSVATSTGNAFGIGQLTTENRYRFGAKLGISPDTTNYCDQLALMREYISERYGNLNNAYNHEVDEGWY